MSVKKQIAILSYLVIVCLISLLSCEDDGEAQNFTIENDVVRVDNPIAMEDIARFVRNNEFQPSELRYKIGEISGGYHLKDGESIDEARENMLKKHEEFLRVSQKDVDARIKDSSDQDDQKRLLGLQKQLQVLSETELKINEVALQPVVVNENSRDTTLVGDRLVDSTLVNVSAVEPRSYYHESWAPYYGTSKVTRGFTYQTFYFDDTSDFGSTSTYEVETQVYDEDYADYDNYYSTNMPNHYYDTPFKDDIDNFTIGCSNASSLSTYYEYYTYMSLSAGPSSTATVRIKGQKGHRFPSWCHSTWCIFADATTSSLITFTAPVYTNLSWTY